LIKRAAVPAPQTEGPGGFGTTPGPSAPLWA
jgi:hypothetical protein